MKEGVQPNQENDALKDKDETETGDGDTLLDEDGTEKDNKNICRFTKLTARIKLLFSSNCN